MAPSGTAGGLERADRRTIQLSLVTMVVMNSSD